MAERPVGPAESGGFSREIPHRDPRHLRDVAEGTEVILTHERLPSMASVESRTHGWAGSLENLAQVL